MSDGLLASMRRLAKVAKRDGRRYETEMIIGYGRGADMGKGFSVFTPDELDAHIALVSGLKTSYDELAKANDALHARVAELEMDVRFSQAELAGLDAKYSDLSTENAKLRYQIKHGIGSGGDGGAAGEPGKPGK